MILPTDHVDVLIIGAGPAGLMLANCFNHSGVKYRIVEKKGAVITAGQADGLKCLTMQILDSIGIENPMSAGACRVDEVAFWDPNEAGRIRRTNIVPDIVPGMDKVREVSLNQGKVERMMLENINRHRDLKVEYGKVPSHLGIDESKFSDPESYPISIRIGMIENSQIDCLREPRYRNQALLSSNNVKEEVVLAKYVVGCDGAHSWTRKRLGIQLHGDHTDSVWGVLDIVPKTDFPDVRKNCVIHSAQFGNMMLIPRENKLVRFYVQLRKAEASVDGPLNKSAYSANQILKAAQVILSPYELSYDYCDWWSAYQVGQRVAENFSVHNRVFLAGDAVHTHSPKAGQGMNTSIQDAYNLGWKLLARLQWKVDPLVLSTYESERRPVAQDLVDFDRGYAQWWAKNLFTSNKEAHDHELSQFQSMYLQNMTYTTSLPIIYPSSPLVQHSSHRAQLLAKNLVPGMRLPDFQVLNQSDAVPCQIHKVLRSDGRFRIVVFPGDISSPKQATQMQELGDRLSSHGSFIYRYTPSSAAIDSRIEIITVHGAQRAAVELQDLPDIFHPWSDAFGWDYWKVYADDVDVHGIHGNAYQACGISTHVGCLVVVRPDGYVGMVAGLGDLGLVDRFFGGFMVEATG